MSASYVYGVVASPGRLPDMRGIDNAPLRLVASGELAAVVGDVPASDLQMDAKAIRAHAAVLDELNEDGTVLPMRFGVVMAGDEQVCADLLEAHAPELTEQLREFDGKVELKLRATYEEESLMREVVAEDQDVARLRTELRGAPEDATYYGRIRLGELVSDAVARKRSQDQSEIVTRLEPLAVAVALGESSHERVVLAGSFLVDRAAIERFDQAVDEIGRDHAGRMRLRYSGPFPPHSFVRLTQEV